MYYVNFTYLFRHGLQIVVKEGLPPRKSRGTGWGGEEELRTILCGLAFPVKPMSTSERL